MVWSLATATRRRRLIDDAASSRASWPLRLAAAIAVIAYNIVGVTDIYSTVVALETGLGEEANPVVRAMMDHAGDGWMVAKLCLQAVISVMVLWFPHWIVLTFFSVATIGNAWVVYNNFVIAGVF